MNIDGWIPRLVPCIVHLDIVWLNCTHLLGKMAMGKFRYEVLTDSLAPNDFRGFMDREQILGEEAQSRVPREFVVQRPNVLNPPTFFMPLMVITQELLDGHLQKEEAGRALQFLETGR